MQSSSHCIGLGQRLLTPNAHKITHPIYTELPQLPFPSVSPFHVYQGLIYLLL